MRKAAKNLLSGTRKDGEQTRARKGFCDANEGGGRASTFLCFCQKGKRGVPVALSRAVVTES